MRQRVGKEARVESIETHRITFVTIGTQRIIGFVFYPSRERRSFFAVIEKRHAVAARRLNEIDIEPNDLTRAPRFVAIEVPGNRLRICIGAGSEGMAAAVQTEDRRRSRESAEHR